MKYAKHFTKKDRYYSRCKIPTLDIEFVNEQVLIDGVVTNQQTKKIVDRSKTYAAFKSPDFSLQNQLAVGGVQNLKPVILPSDDIDADIAAVERLNLFIDNASTADNTTPDS